MRVGILLLFLLGSCWCDTRICMIHCNADDEFDEGVLTPEWEHFMDTLHSLTVDGATFDCVNNTSQKVSVSYKDQIMWDLWFKIYSERLNANEKTLNDCYCAYEDCDSAEFKECIKDVRISMNNEIFTVMMPAIMSKLIELAQEC